ncbi:hypothetical protein D9M70_612300 [compost metagenome]
MMPRSVAVTVESTPLTSTPNVLASEEFVVSWLCVPRLAVAPACTSTALPRSPTVTIVARSTPMNEPAPLERRPKASAAVPFTVNEVAPVNVMRPPFVASAARKLLTVAAVEPLILAPL